MNKTILITGTVFGVSGICLGAFAAHGLENTISEDAIKSFETGVTYQIYHAFFLWFIGSLHKISIKWKKLIYLLVLVGVILFSGSIYGLATNELWAFDFRTIALSTPLGGLLLISAWIILLVALIKDYSNLSN